MLGMVFPYSQGLWDISFFLGTPPTHKASWRKRRRLLTFTGDSLALQADQQGAAQIALVRRLERLDDELVGPLGRAGGVWRVWGNLPHRAGTGSACPPGLFIHRLIGLHKLPHEGWVRYITSVNVCVRATDWLGPRGGVFTIFITFAVIGELLKRMKGAIACLMHLVVPVTNNFQIQCTVQLWLTTTKWRTKGKGLSRHFKTGISTTNYTKVVVFYASLVSLTIVHVLYVTNVQQKLSPTTCH